MHLRRTTADDAGFRARVAELDAELRNIYGAVQDDYAPHNHVETVDTVVVAEHDGVAIGIGCWRAFDATSVEIKRVYVTPARRGQGVAGAVLGELEAWAIERGYRVAVLETGNLQRAAIALYRRCGYVAIARFAPYVEMPASVCMRKSLLDSIA